MSLSHMSLDNEGVFTFYYCFELLFESINTWFISSFICLRFIQVDEHLMENFNIVKEAALFGTVVWLIWNLTIGVNTIEE